MGHFSNGSFWTFLQYFSVCQLQNWVIFSLRWVTGAYWFQVAILDSTVTDVRQVIISFPDISFKIIRPRNFKLGAQNPLGWQSQTATDCQAVNVGFLGHWSQKRMLLPKEFWPVNFKLGVVINHNWGGGGDTEHHWFTDIILDSIYSNSKTFGAIIWKPNLTFVTSVTLKIMATAPKLVGILKVL